MQEHQIRGLAKILGAGMLVAVTGYLNYDSYNHNGFLSYEYLMLDLFVAINSLALSYYSLRDFRLL